MLIGLHGCSTGESTDDLARETTSESAVDARAAWYRGERTLDLTIDGRADSVRLEAWGEGPDSLLITLAFVIDGEEKHRETWGSAYELAIQDSAARDRFSIDSVLRARLDSVLESVVVQRVDAPGVQLMAEDRAILARLDPQPTHRVSYAYGYETTVRLVWDAPGERFVRLWNCC